MRWRARETELAALVKQEATIVAELEAAEQLRQEAAAKFDADAYAAATAREQELGGQVATSARPANDARGEPAA